MSTVFETKLTSLPLLHRGKVQKISLLATTKC